MDDLAKTGSFDVAPIDFIGGTTGLEGVDRDCITLPFLKIAQDSSDQVKKNSSARIEGLEPGMFFCPATKKIYGPEFRGIILKFYRNFAVYDGEGMDSNFLGTITPAEFKNKIENAEGSHRVKSYTLDVNGHRYVDTRNFVMLSLDALQDGPMLLGMASTNIKPSRTLLTQATAIKVVKDGESIQAPIWASVWSLKAAYFENPPYSYYSISDTNRLGWIPKSMAADVKELFDSMVEAHIESGPIEDEPKAEEPKAPSYASPVANVFGGRPTTDASKEPQIF